MLALAWLIFQRGIRATDNRGFLILILAGISLAVGGYLLMAELPAALAAADEDLLQGFWITIMYALGTVPVQLAIGLLLAYLLFQPIRFRAFFRMVYFIPYITALRRHLNCLSHHLQRARNGARQSYAVLVWH